MSRALRIEFPNAIYHVMAGGNGRQRFFISMATTNVRCRTRFGGLLCPPLNNNNTSKLMDAIGLSHPDGVSNLIRRAEIAFAKSKTHTEDLERIDQLLRKP